MLINNISHTAPLFHSASESNLQLIMDNLRAASFHYADDTGLEWPAAKEHLAKAARIINSLQLSYDAIRHLHAHVQPLVPLSELYNQVLIDLRANK